MEVVRATMNLLFIVRWKLIEITNKFVNGQNIINCNIHVKCSIKNKEILQYYHNSLGAFEQKSPRGFQTSIICLLRVFIVGYYRIS